MVALTALWLPILVSAAIVFVVSSILHMVLPYHRSDYKGLPEEEKVRAVLRGLAPALYIIPYCTHQNMKSPEIAAKQKEGPIAFVSVQPNGAPNMGKFLGLWFVFCVIVGVFTGYLTGIAVGPGADHMAVIRVAATAAFMCYGVGLLSNGIWRGHPWGMVLKEIFDAIIYSLAVGATFAYLWPKM